MAELLAAYLNLTETNTRLAKSLSKEVAADWKQRFGTELTDSLQALPRSSLVQSPGGS